MRDTEWKVGISTSGDLKEEIRMGRITVKNRGIKQPKFTWRRRRGSVGGLRRVTKTSEGRMKANFKSYLPIGIKNPSEAGHQDLLIT